MEHNDYGYWAQARRSRRWRRIEGRIVYTAVMGAVAALMFILGSASERRALELDPSLAAIQRDSVDGAATSDGILLNTGRTDL